MAALMAAAAPWLSPPPARPSRPSSKKACCKKPSASASKSCADCNTCGKVTPAISDVRGLGAMIGCEFSDRDGQPDTATASAIAAACQERNLLLLTCGTYDNTIRWIPPLVASSDETERALAIFAEALAEVCGE